MKAGRAVGRRELLEDGDHGGVSVRDSPGSVLCGERLQLRIKSRATTSSPNRRWHSHRSAPRCSGSNQPGFKKLTGWSNDLLYLVDGDPIELRDLDLRQPVVRQGADATELGGRYLAGLAPDRRRSPYLLRCRSRLDLRCIHRRHRPDREDTRLPLRVVLR